ncbi:hypothetical protein J7K42_00140 [bacterium]|nr:hypothetical protein [bacterium]
MVLGPPVRVQERVEDWVEAAVEAVKLVVLVWALVEIVSAPIAEKKFLIKEEYLVIL